MTDEKKPDITIGASEVAPALGLSPYLTPLAWQLGRKGLVDREPETPAQYLGKKLEPVIRESFAERHSVDVTHGDALAKMFEDWHTVRPTGISVRDPRIDWLRASPDGVIGPSQMSHAFAERFGIDVQGGEHVLLECKSAGIAGDTPRGLLGQSWGEPGSDQVPPHYGAQCHTGVMVIDHALREMGRGFMDKALLSVLGPGMVFVDYVVASVEDLRTWLVESLNTVVVENLIGDALLPGRTRDDFDELARVWSRKGTNKNTRLATFDDEVAMAEWAAAHAAFAAADLNKARVRAEMVQRIGDDYGLHTESDRVLLTMPEGAPAPTRKPAKIVDDIVEFFTSTKGGPLTQTSLNAIIARHTTVGTHATRALQAPKPIPAPKPAKKAKAT